MILANNNYEKFKYRGFRCGYIMNLIKIFPMMLFWTSCKARCLNTKLDDKFIPTCLDISRHPFIRQFIDEMIRAWIDGKF